MTLSTNSHIKEYSLSIPKTPPVTKPAGRPVGAVSTTPEAILRLEMRKCAATITKIRDLVDGQVKVIGKHLDEEEVELSDRLGVIKTLTACIEPIAKAMDSASKYLFISKKVDPTDPEKGKDSSADESPEDAYARLASQTSNSRDE